MMSSYAIAEGLNAWGISASGVISVVFTALVFGSYVRGKNVSAISRHRTLGFWENLNFIATALVFLVLGSEVNLSLLYSNLFPGFLIAIAFCFFIRPLTIWLSMLFDKDFSFKEKMFISWIGNPRGAVSAALASIVLSGVITGSYAFAVNRGWFSLAEAQSIFSITIIVIFFTILISVFTAKLASSKLLGIRENPLENEYLSLVTESRAMSFASSYLKRDYDRGLISEKIFKDITKQHKILAKSVERRLNELVLNHPELELGDHASKVKELIEVQIDFVEQAFIRSEISEDLRNTLIQKYNALLSRIEELEKNA
ncbi:Na(+)/H(+) antiporter 1 [uncultured archaeon]|nr:Na(+)/H(+) antiporter 1 [uncultured archaeon]